MKSFICVLACAAVAALPAAAQESALTAQQILDKVDEVLYAPKDKDVKMRFVLIDKNGKESNRDCSVLEKGSNRRLMKFTAPADQKGIGFLSLSDNVMYVYLPAFGKARRIASHVKNTKFAGSDFTYENLEAKKYSGAWEAKMLSSGAECYILQQTPRPGTKTDYSKINTRVRKDNFYPVRVEYYDKSGALHKVLTRDKVEKIGNYWESRETMMEDLKIKHKTKLLLLDVKFDIGIGDDKFSERYLMQ